MCTCERCETARNGSTIMIRGFVPVAPEFVKSYEKQSDIIMPLRGTKHSAGYDFFAPCDIELLPEESIIIWSDVKAYMLEDEVLKVYPRSSIGIKKSVRIKNTVGIIDADYYSNPNNDGNIGICLFNFGFKNVTIGKGEGIAQAIFQKFLISDNCNTEQVRVGGVGSTNK